MAEELTVTTEYVDDILLLIAWMERMGAITLTNEHFSAHGNWQGLDLGCVQIGWLAPVLLEADHRLNQVLGLGCRAHRDVKHLPGRSGADPGFQR